MFDNFNLIKVALGLVVFVGAATLQPRFCPARQADSSLANPRNNKNKGAEQKQKDEQKKDLVLPESFEITELRVRFDYPDRFGIKFSDGTRSPESVTETRPVYVNGQLWIVGNQARQPKNQDSKARSGQLTLTFRAVPLISIFDASKAIKAGNKELVEVVKDPKTGNNLIVYHVDPVPQGEPNAEELTKTRTRWRQKEADQVYQLKVPFDVPNKTGKTVVKVRFEFTWQPKDKWKMFQAFAIDVNHSLGVNLERTAVFKSASVASSPPDVEIGRQIKFFIYFMLTRMGFDLDAQKWWGPLEL